MEEERAPSYAQKLRDLLDEYETAVRQARARKTPGSGLLGFGPKRGDDPCHEAFDQKLEALFAAMAAVDPPVEDAADAREEVEPELLRRRGGIVDVEEVPGERERVGTLPREQSAEPVQHQGLLREPVPVAEPGAKVQIGEMDELLHALQYTGTGGRIQPRDPPCCASVKSRRNRSMV